MSRFVVNVVYPYAPDAKFDYSYYTGAHAQLVGSLLGPEGLVEATMNKGFAAVDGGAPPFLIMASLVFDDIGQLQRAVAKHSAELMADIPKFTNITPQIQISEEIVRVTSAAG